MPSLFGADWRLCARRTHMCLCRYRIFGRRSSPYRRPRPAAAIMASLSRHQHRCRTKAMEWRASTRLKYWYWGGRWAIPAEACPAARTHQPRITSLRGPARDRAHGGARGPATAANASSGDGQRHAHSSLGLANQALGNYEVSTLRVENVIPDTERPRERVQRAHRASAMISRPRDSSQQPSEVR